MAVWRRFLKRTEYIGVPPVSCDACSRLECLISGAVSREEGLYALHRIVASANERLDHVRRRRADSSYWL